MWVCEGFNAIKKKNSQIFAEVFFFLRYSRWVAFGTCFDNSNL